MSEETQTAVETMPVRIVPARGVAPLASLRFNDEQIALIKRTVCKGASDDELALFLYQAQRTGLDPLSRQIYSVPRGDGDYTSRTIQTGIDGYRVIAERTGTYAGNDDYEYGPDVTDHYRFTDKWKKLQEGDFTHPAWAKARVWRIVAGMRVAFEATAHWSEYYPGDKQGYMWRKLSHLMPGKCAEALALRKAFPLELSGLYTHEEMEQAGPAVDVLPPVKPKPDLGEQLVATVFPGSDPNVTHAQSCPPEDPEPQAQVDEPPDAGAEQAPVHNKQDEDVAYTHEGEKGLDTDYNASWCKTYLEAYGTWAAEDSVDRYASRALWFHSLHAYWQVAKKKMLPQQKEAVPDLTFKKPMEEDLAARFRQWCVEKGIVKG